MVNHEPFLGITKAYYSIFDNIRDEIFVFDLDARLIYTNKAGELSEGYRLEEAKGKSLFELYNFENDIRLDCSPCYIALTEHRNVDSMVCIYHSGEKLNKKEISSRLIYQDGEIVGVFTVQHDIEDIYDLVDNNLSLQHQLNLQRTDYYQHKKDPFEEIPSFSDTMDQCLNRARRAAATSSAIMLNGPDGSERSVLARAIHDAGKRSGKPFITFNCSHFSGVLLENMIFGAVYYRRSGEDLQGLLEQADGGTLYLEDITSLPDNIQNKLLNYLENGGKFHKVGGSEEMTSDVRLICSCKETPFEITKHRLLQMQLFYYLSVVYIQVPSLNERKKEIPQLVNYYIQLYNKRFQKHVKGIDSTASSYFNVYDWPGNIRQLSKCIEAAMNIVDDYSRITIDELPANMFYGIKFTLEDSQAPEKELEEPVQRQIRYDPEAATKNKEKIQENARAQEKERLVQALQQNNGNITHAAAALGISRQLLYYRIKKYNIQL